MLLLSEVDEADVLTSVRLGAADLLTVVTQPLAGSDPPDASVRVVGVRRFAQLKAVTKTIIFSAIYVFICMLW